MLFKFCLEANLQKTTMAENATDITTGEDFNTIFGIIFTEHLAT